MKAVAIIQARMGSTRLPGKVMKTLCGRTVLGHVITRVKACPLVDEIVVATTQDPQDDVIVAEARKFGARTFRGSEEDVLSRYYFAAGEAGADIVVRVTSDCPLFDPHLLNTMLGQFHADRSSGRGLDYLSNTLERTYPRGLDAEIFTFSALERSHVEARQPHEREHVTPYIYQHPEFFALKNFSGPVNLSDLRWTLDTEEDWRLIEAIYAVLGNEEPFFSTQAVLQLLESQPELVSINAHVEQKELGA